MLFRSISTWSFLDSVYVWKSLTNLKEWKVYILNGSLIHGLDRARVPDRGKRHVRYKFTFRRWNLVLSTF